MIGRERTYPAPDEFTRKFISHKDKDKEKIPSENKDKDASLKEDVN